MQSSQIIIVKKLNLKIKLHEFPIFIIVNRLSKSKIVICNVYIDVYIIIINNK